MVIGREYKELGQESLGTTGKCAEELGSAFEVRMKRCGVRLGVMGGGDRCGGVEEIARSDTELRKTHGLRDTILCRNGQLS